MKDFINNNPLTVTFIALLLCCVPYAVLLWG